MPLATYGPENFPFSVVLLPPRVLASPRHQPQRTFFDSSINITSTASLTNHTIAEASPPCEFSLIKGASYLELALVLRLIN